MILKKIVTCLALSVFLLNLTGMALARPTSNGPIVVSVIIDNGPPSNPTGLTVTSVGSGSVTLRWNANPELDVIDYTIHYGTQSGNYPNSLQVSGTTQTVTGLTNGVRYFFVVTARDQAGHQSGFSNEVNAVPSGGGGGGGGERRIMLRTTTDDGTR